MFIYVKIELLIYKNKLIIIIMLSLGINKNESDIMKIYMKRKPVLTNSDDNKIILITSKELKEINPIIKHPSIQAILDDDKIKEMCEIYSEDSPYNKFFLSCALITIARIVIGEFEEYYLLDGQHRYNMALDLLEKNEDNNKSFLLCIITIKQKQEIIDLMKYLNKDSIKYPPQPPDSQLFPHFSELIFYDELKELLINKYPFLPKRSSINTNIYTVIEFLYIVKEKLIKNKFKTDDVNIFYKNIKIKEKEFFNSIGYLEKMHEHKEKFKKSELTCIENKSCMFMKKNNFIAWLLNPLEKPDHDYKIRISIDKVLQEKTWQKEYGACTSGKCPIFNCQKILAKNVSNSWQCGHIISHNNGGPTTIDNLRPLCTPCNRTMNDTDWDDYENELMRNDIIDNYFDDEIEINCKSKYKCKNKINKNTFLILKINDKLKPICFECKTKYINNN